LKSIAGMASFFAVAAFTVADLIVPAAAAADSLYDAGLKAYKAGDYAKACASFEQSLKKSQSDPNLWYYDALCFHQLKNWPMATSRYKTIATYFPQTAAGKAAIDALKKLDPSFVPPSGGSATGANAAAAPSSAASPGAGAAGATGNSDVDTGLAGDKAKSDAALAKELATLPDTANFYFKKGPEGHMEVDLMVNGHPVKAIFDTGASAFFYADQLKEAGLDLNHAKAGGAASGWAGVKVATTVIPATITLGTLTRKLDIRMQESTSGLSQNLIGQDMVRGYQYEIDDKGGRVDLKKAIAIKSSDINPLYDIPLVKIGPKDFVKFSVNNNFAMAFIDTGASNTIFSSAAAAQLGIQPTGETVPMTGVGGDFSLQKAYVNIRIGGMLRENFPVLIGGSGMCALGQDLMDGWRYKVDREHNLLRFYH
jgi:predicted aspartyl protease